MTILASVCLVLALELAVVGWHGSSLRRLVRPSWSNAFEIGMLIVFLSGSVVIFERLAWGQWPSRAAAQMPHLGLRGPAAFAIFLIVTDFCLYWSHRALHTRWLWWLHEVHHQPDDITALTVFRNNPLVFLLDPVIGFLPALVATGQPLLLLLIPHTTLLHSAVRWDYGWIGRWIWLSPMAHRIHHSKRLEYKDKNFASFLPIWDRLFGTWATA